MSDLISAWVDQNEMRRLAESLLASPVEHDLDQLEVDLGGQFEGYANLNVGLKPESGQSLAPPPEAPAAAYSPQPMIQAAPVSVPPALPVGLGSGGVSQGVNPAAKPPSEVAVADEATMSSETAPSVMRSAVQFLRKAQSEGRAGGVIRDEKNSPVVAPTPLSGVETVNVPTVPKPAPRQIHSPFRRIGEGEEESSTVKGESEAQLPKESSAAGRILRPKAPSGEEPILVRVTKFGKWLKGSVGVRNFFVSNTEGKILLDEVANPKLIQVARSLAGASGASDGQVTNLHVRIGEDSILEVVPTPSQFGILILGLIVEHPLPEEVIREVRLGLQEVANARLLKSQS